VLLDANRPTVRVLLLSVNVPDVSVKLFDGTASVALPLRLNVMSDLSTVVAVATAVEATVTVAAVPELASKKTTSAVVGADTPPAPPDVAAQLTVELASHVPEPPTQNLFAIVNL
jgi:hypothetical protein